MTNKIKTELQKISKEEKSPYLSVNDIAKKRKKKDNDSVSSDINILVKSNNIQRFNLKKSKMTDISSINLGFFVSHIFTAILTNFSIPPEILPSS